jgi:hypothetical protein
VQPLTTDATTALVRAVRVNLVNLAPGCTLKLDEIRSRGWASVTFTGARHELAVTLSGSDAEVAAARFADGLDVAEFRLRGHILADIELVSSEVAEDGVRLRLEALTVED